MTDFDKGKMFHRLSPDERQAGEHGAPAGEKDDYTPVIPVPKDAPAPDWNKLRPTEATGDPVWTWPYHTAAGGVAFYVARWKPKDPNDPKEKVIRPATWNGTDWRLEGMPAPRPLYGLPAIHEFPDKPVVVVEGEKCADAARDAFPCHVVTTWSQRLRCLVRDELATARGPRSAAGRRRRCFRPQSDGGYCKTPALARMSGAHLPTGGRRRKGHRRLDRGGRR